MKKLLLSALSVLAFGAMNVDAQVQKTPFVEHFTQASCGPCASQNPTMYTTLNTFGTGNYVKLTYQVSWPGVDPMNAEFPAGPNDRRNYYGVTGVPDCSLSGGATAAPNTAVTAATLAAKAAETTPYAMTASHAWNGSDIDVTIEVTNTTGASVSSMDMIYVSMIEDHIAFATAPGSNGETDFFYVNREFYNASTGAAGATGGTALGAIAGGATTTFTFTVTAANIPAYIRDLNEVSFVAFIQNNSSQAVDQAAKSTSGNVPGLLDVASAANSTVGAGYCNYAFTPSVNFTNNGSVPVTTVTAEYTINGGGAVSQTYNTAPINMGQTVAINFPAGTLAPGTSTVQYSITDVNSGGLFSSGPNNMAPEEYSKLTVTGAAAPMVEGFENGAAVTFDRSGTNGLFDDAGAAGLTNFSMIDGVLGGLTNPTGGNAASARSLMFRFYNLNGSEQMNFVLQKVNLTTGSQVTFNHSYKQYQAENDRLEVMVSTDCGATWTTEFNEAGATLMTEPAATAQFYPQAASEWDPNTVSLGAYDGMNDVIVMFRGTSAYGNNLFVDDINITSGGVSVLDLNFDVANVEIMPNPVNNKMVVNFTAASDNANIVIRNVQGQTVKELANHTVIGENSVAINTTELPAGIYTLTIVSDVDATTKRFVVSK